MKSKLNLLKSSTLLSRTQLKSIVAGYGGNGCGTCANGQSYCVSNSKGQCSCPLGGGCV